MRKVKEFYHNARFSMSDSKQSPEGFCAFSVKFISIQDTAIKLAISTWKDKTVSLSGLNAQRDTFSDLVCMDGEEGGLA